MVFVREQKKWLERKKSEEGLSHRIIYYIYIYKDMVLKVCCSRGGYSGCNPRTRIYNKKRVSHGVKTSGAQDLFQEVQRLLGRIRDFCLEPSSHAFFVFLTARFSCCCYPRGTFKYLRQLDLKVEDQIISSFQCF